MKMTLINATNLPLAVNVITRSVLRHNPLCGKHTTCLTKVCFIQCLLPFAVNLKRGTQLLEDYTSVKIVTFIRDIGYFPFRFNQFYNLKVPLNKKRQFLLL